MGARRSSLAFDGNTFVLPMISGGYTASPNFDLIKPEMMITPTKNLNLQDGVRAKRGGTAKVDATAVVGTPQITGIFDYRKKNGNRFTMFSGNDGSVYKNFTTTIKTGMSTTNRIWFETFEDEVYFCDGATTPQYWDGAAGASANITTLAGDWTGSNFPLYVVKHGRNVSQRLFYFGCPTTPETMYISANNDGKTANSLTLVVETRDGYGVVGAIPFGNRLMIFGRKETFFFEDSLTDTATWGYQKSQFEGGVAHQRLLVATPNKLYAMMEDGEIYEVATTQAYGDYVASSITRPSFMHKWIQDNAKLSSIADFHGTYDPVQRVVRIWVVRTGETQADTCLKFYIDRPVEDAWMIEDNLDNPSGYQASVSAVVRPSSGSVKVYTGSYDGFVWELESTANTDDSLGYSAKFRTPPMVLGNPRSTKTFRKGWLVFFSQGDYDVTIRWWVDGVQQSDLTVTTAGSGAVYGSGTYGTAVYGGAELSESSFDLGYFGKRLQLEVENAVAGEDFAISQVLIDYKDHGARA